MNYKKDKEEGRKERREGGREGGKEQGREGDIFKYVYAIFINLRWQVSLMRQAISHEEREGR